MNHIIMNKKFFLAILLLFSSFNSSLFTLHSSLLYAQDTTSPGARWWWLGSAVDKENLRWNMEQYASHGIGALEITPLYGVKGNSANNIEYLSPKWMEMLRYVEDEGKRLGIEIDMNNGTGWPFGGPTTPIEEAACKALIVDTIVSAADFKKGVDFVIPEKEKKFAKLDFVQSYPTDKKDMLRVIALYVSRTRQQVKRAAPGGQGYVIDHFDRDAVKHYLDKFDKAFGESGTPWPHTIFNDSYEVYGADWTPTLPAEFEKRRGYSLKENINKLVDRDPQVVSDYRETLSDMLLDNFTRQWVAWAHGHGMLVRNQAHGSPANLLDLYAAVDIPEIEGFGLSEFGIKGLRVDPGMTKLNDSDYSMFKYAPSAAHVSGKNLVSSETFTWLTEHFRTSFSQMKPDLDLMFCAGVNHMYFHGICYSPKDDVWPGWKFYASIDMSPTNSIWRDAEFFNNYVKTCQTMLQSGKPDNDVLVYFPVRNLWKDKTKTLLMQFAIHNLGELAPAFKRSILELDSLGYDCDYISDRQLLACTSAALNDGNCGIMTEAGIRYRALLIPDGAILTESLKSHIADLQSQGVSIIYGNDEAKLRKVAVPEVMKTQHGLKMIRRKVDAGYSYFIANLTPNDVNAYVQLAVPFKDAQWFDPLTGKSYSAEILDGNLRLDLRSGESMILHTFSEPQNAGYPSRPVTEVFGSDIELTDKWTLSFTEEAPKVDGTFTLDSPRTWENLSDAARITMGTGVYETVFKVKQKPEGLYAIDLGDVRESARVYINNEFVGCAWSVPYVLNFDASLLKKGKNTLRIEVTNLPANRIADLDRKGVEWRKFEEINVVDIKYQKTKYDNWAPMPSGLNSKVRIYGVE